MKNFTAFVLGAVLAVLVVGYLLFNTEVDKNKDEAGTGAITVVADADQAAATTTEAAPTTDTADKASEAGSADKSTDVAQPAAAADQATDAAQPATPAVSSDTTTQQ